MFWNPYNKIVQCHRCGETFVPISAESIPYARIAVENTRGSGAGTVRFTRIDTPLITVEPTQGSASTTLRIYNWDDFK
ncbi:MAG TPA: hypothetical protein VFN11_19460 [Ktedonobacterales bacterium]|nr:hypothetical protein [Ktedonobacterales bacterium]